ncbi:hypothetical protein [Streptomyces sp. NPDC058745]|uniref:hypothetical protein n=1 Tax=Streptomyces sp. NPDC058745 TaxID=3346621 RepID=UPI0036C4B51E
MANIVWHKQWGIELDLTRDDLGHESMPNLWDLLYKTDRLHASRGVPVSQRGLLCGGVCKKAGVEAWMYLREINGRKQAVHERSEDEDRHHAALSDEHKAYQERICLVSEADGHQADSEVRTSIGPRSWIQTDTLVRGADGILIGWEIQLSTAAQEGPRSVKARANKASKHGITPAWHTDRSDYASRNDVHWTRSDNLPAEVIAKSGDLRVVSGYRALDFWRCDHRALYRCPETQRRCGAMHVTPKPRDVFFDDLVRRTAAGRIVPVQHRVGTSTHRFWVTDADRDRLDDLNGGRLVLPSVEPDDERELPTAASHRAPTCRPTTRLASPTEGAAPARPAVSLPAIPTQPVVPIRPLVRPEPAVSPRPAPAAPDRPVGAWPIVPAPAPVAPVAPSVAPTAPPGAAVAIPKQPGPGRLLDWRSSEHWAPDSRPCRYCSKGTQMRDNDGRPSHKTCAEEQGV